MILLSFGAIQNFEIVKNDSITYNDLFVSFGNVLDSETEDGVTYYVTDGSIDNGKVKELTSLLNKKTLSSLADIIYIGKSYIDGIEPIEMVFRLEYSKKDDSFIPYMEAYNNSPVSAGRLYTVDEFINGEKLIVLPSDFSSEYVGKEISINNEKYTVCGIDAVDPFASIPYSGSPDSIDDITYLCFTSNTVINNSVYNDIVSCVRTVFGDYAVIPEVDTISDKLPFYNSIIILSVMLSVLSAITLMLLYNYILGERNKSIAIFRICGSTVARSCRLFLCEIFVTSLFSFAFASLIFFMVIQDKLKNSFEYINQVYNIESYFIMLGIYLFITLLVSSFMVFLKVKLNPVLQLKNRGDL